MTEGREFLPSDGCEDCQDGWGSMSSSPVAGESVAHVPTWEATVRPPWSATNPGIWKRQTWPYRSQQARLGLVLYFKNNENFHLCFKKVSLTAGWRTDGVGALVKNGHPGDFPGGPAVKILPSSAGRPEFNPWSGN